MQYIGRFSFGLYLFLASTALADTGIERTPVEFHNDDVRLAGSLLIPRSGEPLPGLVLVHGSGPGERTELLEIAMRLTQGGLAVLIYDKRGSGQSGGNWMTSSLTDLADDAAAAFRFMAEQPNVDARRVGFWGVSQGGWVVPLAASLSSPAFAIIVTGGGSAPRDVESAMYRNKVRNMDASTETLDAADALVDAYFDYLAGAITNDTLKETIEPNKSEAWYRALGIGNVIPSPGNRHNWEWVATFDPRESIRAMALPVLVLLGANDPLTPVPATAKIWWESLSAATEHNRVIVFPNAGHAMRTGGHGGAFVAGYVTTQLDWLQTVGVLRENL